MNRPWLIWSVLVVCAALILGMFSWITVRALDSEQEKVEAESEARLGERVRLSMARMDGVGTDLLVIENLRPPMHYQSFYSPNDVLTNQLQGVEPGIVLQASPLLMEQVDFVHLHFEIQSDDHLESPQVPFGNERERALGSGLADAIWAERDALFERLKIRRPTREKAAQLFQQGSLIVAQEPLAENLWLTKNNARLVQSDPKLEEKYQGALDKRENAQRSRTFADRVTKAAKKSENRGKVLENEGTKSMVPGAVRQDPNEILSVSPFLPLWHGEELFFLREVHRRGGRVYQGLWVAVDQLLGALSTEMSADLGEVQLVRSDRASEGSSTLVSLPWSLEVGSPPQVQVAGLTPLRKTLIVGWAAALLSLLAFFFLLRGVMILSARRAAFVSSVTHELRTPLTTFRLYSEMLAEGMVTDEVKRTDYLKTMLSESERLNHLVENVLSYARIERGNARSKFETLSVEDLIERNRPVLQRRVDQEDAALSIKLEPGLGSVRTDVTAVGQILFNLVDNACKYGLPEEGGRYIELRVLKRGNGLELEVSDEGRGIARSDKRRLFRAFHKSASDAAHDKPGVGLGLALCRRLAKALGGDLKLARSRKNGASFVLELPATTA